MRIANSWTTAASLLIYLGEGEEMVDIKSLVFLGMMMQGLGTLFLTVQLWGAAWGLEKTLGLREQSGKWLHIVRDGLVLQIVGTGINILSISYWFAS